MSVCLCGAVGAGKVFILIVCMSDVINVAIFSAFHRVLSISHLPYVTLLEVWHLLLNFKEMVGWLIFYFLAVLWEIMLGSQSVLILFSTWGELCFLHSPILARLAIIKKVSSECINPWCWGKDLKFCFQCKKALYFSFPVQDASLRLAHPIHKIAYSNPMTSHFCILFCVAAISAHGCCHGRWSCGWDSCRWGRNWRQETVFLGWARWDSSHPAADWWWCISVWLV